MSKLLEMLQQRGVDTATTEALDATPLPADATKYGEGANATVVCVVNRQRINEKDVATYKAFVQKSGAGNRLILEK